MTEPTSFVRALDHFLLHRQCQRQSFWSHTLDEHLFNCLVQLSSRNPLTGGTSLLNTFVRTEVIGHDPLPSPLVIAHRRPLSTPATEDESLQERWPLAWRGEALGSIGLTVHRELHLISLVILPLNVAGAGRLSPTRPTRREERPEYGFFHRRSSWYECAQRRTLPRRLGGG